MTRRAAPEDDLDLDLIPDTTAHVYLNEAGEKRSYSREFKIQAAYNFIITGSCTRVAETLAVDKMLISQWKDSDWWPVAVAAARRIFSREIEGKMAEGMLLAQAAVVDRLTHGDVKMDRNGDQSRVPVSAKDAAVILAISFDKRQLMVGGPTSSTSRSRGAGDRAEELRRRNAEKKAAASGGDSGRVVELKK